MIDIIGSGGGGGCFRKGTKILQEYGKTTDIDLLQVGDLVLSYDESGKVYTSKVTQIHYHKDPEPLIRVNFWNGSIDITPNHWVLNQYHAFMDVGNLSTEDALVDGMGHLRPIKLVESLSAEPVWNLTVEPNHTFIANNIRVHNGGYRSRFPIVGSGGGGGKGGGGTSRAAVEAADSLHSKQYAKLIDLLGEGEIVGLVDGFKSVYLNDTPIQNADGTYNFTDVEMVERVGTQTQTYIPGFESATSEKTGPGLTTKAITAAPVTIDAASNIDAVVVTVKVDQLMVQDTTTGDLSGTSVNFSIQLNTNGVGYVEVKNDTISGKTTSGYRRSYRVELTGVGPWQIKLVRVTDDATTSNRRDKLYFESYTVVTDAKLSYPNSALIALSIDSEQFNSIPTRGYEIKGLKVKIPSNYDPITRVYTGIWDGTFSYAWTDNPAWCFYDLITSTRYGLGNYISSTQVDKWSLYSIGQYCDELVSDGFGGTEPRFTCNLYLQSRDEAYNVINSMASIFRGMIYWAGGAIVPVQDAPGIPVAIFTPANIIDGVFNYEGSSAKARHTIALVSWNDPNDRYKQKIEYVEDADAIERFGVIESDILAVGCTSRGQAHRLGRWLLYSEQLESEIITFKTGLEGLVVNPGNIFKTSDPVRSGERRGGRIISATTSSIVLDQEVTIEPNTTELTKVYTLWVTLPNGTVESRTVSNTPGVTSTLVFTNPFSYAPQVMSIWIMGYPSVSPETWRALSIKEVSNSQAEITALAHNENKYNYVENDLVLEPLQISSISIDPPPPVTDITIIESLYAIGLGVIGTKATVSWLPSSTAQYYILRYKQTNENPIEIITYSTSVDIGPLTEGMYTFTVSAYNTIGKKSQPIAKSQEIFGKLVPPVDVSNFNLAVVNGNAYITWNPASDLDVLTGGYIRIRYTPNLTGGTWNNAIDIGPNISGMATSTTLPLLTGTYLAKWVDSTGHQSINAVAIETDAADILGLNYVLEIAEHPTFPGIKTNMVYEPTLSILAVKLNNNLNIDNVPGNIDTWSYIDSLGGIQSSGSYNFANTTDLGHVYTSRVTSRVLVELFDSNGFIDAKTDNIDSWLSIDGSAIDDVSAILMIRTTNDNPSGSPTWSAWQPFYIGDWTARAFQFRLDITNSSATHNIYVKELSVTIDMPDRIDIGSDIISGAGVYHVTYTPPFMVVPNISITTQNMYTGDYYVITNKTTGGFDIEFKNSAGTSISRTFDWQVRGY